MWLVLAAASVPTSSGGLSSFLYILEILGVVVGCLVGIALIVAYFRKNLGESTIKLYKDRLEILEDTVGSQKTQIAEQEKDLSNLRHTNDVLRETVTSAAAVSSLAAQVATDHQRILEAIHDSIKASNNHFDKMQTTLETIAQNGRH